MAFVKHSALHGLQIPLLSTVCLLTETWRSPAQGSQDKTMSIPGMSIPGCSVASLKINSEWIKRTFSLHCLSYFVLVWSRLHTLFRHPEQFWYSGAHLRAWPRFICPLTSHCPLHTFAEEIGLSFVMFCNPDCTGGFACVAGCLCYTTWKPPKTEEVSPKELRTSELKLETPPWCEQLLGGCFPTETGHVF